MHTITLKVKSILFDFAYTIVTGNSKTAIKLK